MATNPSKRRLGAFANPLSKLEPSWRSALQMPAVAGLIALLLVQLVAALVLAGQGLTRIAPDEPLLGISPQQISGIEITADDETLLLQRSPDGWVLPDLAGFPADGGKVDRLLTTLSELQRTLPVAASADARQRLKVADDNATVRIRLQDENGTLVDLLTGDSPGFRRLYGRLAGEDAVFDLPLAAFEVARDSDDWVIRDRLHLDADAITRVTADDWTLTKAPDGNWQLDDDTRALDQGEVEALLRRIANQSYQGVLNAPAEGSNPEDPALRLGITLDGGKTLERLVSRDGEGGYLMQTGSEPFVYKLSEYDLEGVIDLDLDTLRVEEDPTPGTADADEDATSATAEDAPPPQVDQDDATAPPAVPAAPAPDAEETNGGDASQAPSAEPPAAATEPPAAQAADAASQATATSDSPPVREEPEARNDPNAPAEQSAAGPLDGPASDAAPQPPTPQTQPTQSPLPRQPYQQPYGPPQPPPWPPGRPGPTPPAGWR